MRLLQNPSATRRGLVIVNAALLALLVLVAWGRSADAQNSAAPPAGRARGEYTMVAGKSNTGGSEVVYIIDASNQEMVALKWDQSRQAMSAVGYRNMGADTRATPGR